MTTIRAVTKLSEIDTSKFYQMYDNMTPTEAARRYEAVFGHVPVEVLIYGQWIYVEQPRPLQALAGKRR